MECPQERAASDLLEDALQQFDNIIEGSGQSNVADFYKNAGMIDEGFQGIGQLLDDLKMTIEAEQISSEDTVKLLSLLPPKTLQFYRDLFNIQIVSAESNTDINKKLRTDKDSLALQVSVLTDQVELQMDKMEELVQTIKDLQGKLQTTEESLQQEILSRTEHESHALVLMEQVSNLKIQLVQHEQLERKANDILVSDDDVRRSPLRMNGSGHINHKDQDLMSPDEGIVNDDGDDAQGKQIIQLRMPEPKATSTPIAAGATSTDKAAASEPRMESDSPEIKSANDILKSTSRSTAFNDQLRSISLERLHGRRVAPSMDANDLQKSSSQNENLNCSAKVDVSPEKLSSQSNPKSSSSPNLAVADVTKDSYCPEEESNTGSNNTSSSRFQSRKKHGFKKFFTSFRLRRSHSSSLQNTESPTSSTSPGKQQTPKSGGIEQFQRGRFRATTGPRLGWTRPQKPNMSSSSPFSQWTIDEICDWFTELGLVSYIDNCKSWVTDGATLLRATNQDIEKELGIRNPLHKKKLMLSLQALGEEEEVDGLVVKGRGMDMVWVSRWLDDIGLPQYKDAFHEACIDGRMLHHLTIADLQRLRVTNLLHTLSLRRAIYTLRNINFDPTRLKRRPVDETVEKEDVALWTNHRVMEWLRSIDLAEYAPNLRGSGVHGSLMVLEPQFTGEIMASLLHIPNSKSLLRRHLCAKFNDIMPPEHRRKEGEVSSLNISVKVKIGKRSFGPLTRLRGSSGYSTREFSNGEYVCPIETKNSGSGMNKSLGSHRRNLESKLQMQDVRDRKNWNITDEKDIVEDEASNSSDIKVVELNENTTRKIEAFSAELATMTNKWSED